MFYIFPEIEGEQKRLGISIKFHEDSTLRDLSDGIVEANTPSEFMQASLPGKRFFPGGVDISSIVIDCFTVDLSPSILMIVIYI